MSSKCPELQSNIPPNTGNCEVSLSSSGSQPIEDAYFPNSTRTTIAERKGEPVPSGRQETEVDLKTLDQDRIPECESQDSNMAKQPDELAIHKVVGGSDAGKAPHIPNEICLMILRLLSRKDILSTRQVSKNFSELGAGLLFRPFVFKPNRDDFNRFHTVADYPHLIAGLKSVRFETGTMDIYHAVKEFARNLSLQYKHALPDNSTGQFAEKVEGSAILEYATWNSKWRYFRQEYKEAYWLESLLRRAPRLSSIVISKKACSFKHYVLFWGHGEGDLSTSFQRTNDEFAALLIAVKNTLNDRLRVLSHDKVPVTFFTQDRATLISLTHPFRHLTTLHLTLDATEPPFVSFWKGLGCVLRSANNLLDLRFGFDPVERNGDGEGAWYLSQEPEHWQLPLWKLLSDHTWQRLQTLRLDGLLLCEIGLMELLRRHVSTLRHLRLCNVGLWQGSFQSTLTSIRDSFLLESFELSLHARAFHTPDEHWLLWPISDPRPFPRPSGIRTYMSESLEKAGFNKDSHKHESSGMKLADFVLRNGPWPSKDLRPFPKDRLMEGHSPLCDECIMTRDGINEEWDDTDKSQYEDEVWEVSEYAHLISGVDFQPGDDVCELYQEDGYDEDGFNRQGFNANGLHYTDPLVQPEDGFIADGRLAALKKDVLSEIKRNIPRYNK